MTKRLRNHNRSWGNGDEPAGHGEVEMSKPSPHLWTAEDEDQLRWVVTAGKNVEMIAAQLNRSPSAVRAKAYKLSLLLGYSGSTRRR